MIESQKWLLGNTMTSTITPNPKITFWKRKSFLQESACSCPSLPRRRFRCNDPFFTEKVLMDVIGIFLLLGVTLLQASGEMVASVNGTDKFLWKMQQRQNNGNDDILTATATMADSDAVLVAIDVPWPSCLTRPSVIFSFSLCFSDQEISAAISALVSAIMPGAAFFRDGRNISPTYAYYAYKSDACRTKDFLGDLPLPRAGAYDASQFWVDFVSDSEEGYATYVKQNYKLAGTAAFRVCPTHDCIFEAGDVEITSIEEASNYIPTILGNIFCDSQDTFPASYLDSNNLQQCACCSIGEQCICPDGEIFSRLGECTSVCASNEKMIDGECVSIVQMCSDDTSVTCLWSSARPELSLENCGFTLPAVADNYVDGDRANTNDATHTGPVIGLIATSRLTGEKTLLDVE